MVNLSDDRRGWLRIVEVTIALAIVLGFIIYSSSSNTNSPRTDSKNPYTELVLPILNNLAENNTLRAQIVAANNPESYEALNTQIEETILPISQREGFSFLVNVSDSGTKVSLDPTKSKSYSGKDIRIFERIISSDSSSSNFHLKKITIFVW